MLYTSEIKRLNAMPEYKKAKGILSNFSYVHGCYKNGAKADVKFSLNDKVSVSVGVPLKAILHLFKPIIIAREMSVIKSQVADRAFNEKLNDYNLKSIIRSKNYVWMDLSLSKLYFIQDFLNEFFSETIVVDCVLEACEHLHDKEEKKKKYNETIDVLNKKINNEIELCKKILIVTEVISCCGYEEIYKIIVQHATTGELTKREEE